MLPVKLKLVSIKNILSRWLHIGCLASHIIFTCWPTQRVGLYYFFFTGQLNVLAYLIFAFFYWPTQRVGLSHFFYWPTQRVGLL